MGTMAEDETSGGLGGGGAPALAADAVVAGRYRIVRFLARGGMGEVYEAEDRELKEHIALKTLRSFGQGSGSTESRAIDRFKREVALARKVTHANVCRIFDLGVDDPSAAPDDRVLFLTMELLGGESLAERIKRGPLPPSEALPLLAQMAEALAAAHAAGVIHRDFKSSNVMLVPSPGRPLRAVVTDFGLARPEKPDRGADRDNGERSTDGVLVGSPKYMAPEQVEGLPLSPAADVYALGVVAFEMLTGRVPFAGETPLQTALKRLTEPPPSLRSVAPTLPPAWDAALHKCLARDPGQRFADARAFVAALAPAEATTSATSTRLDSSTAPTVNARGAASEDSLRTAPFEKAETAPLVRVGRNRALAVIAAVAGALLLFAGGALVSRALLQPAARTVGPHLRRSVAVVGFQNLSGRPDAAWLDTAFTEMLDTELGASGSDAIRTAPSDAVQRMKKDLALPAAPRYAPAELSRMRDQLDVDWVVTGSYVLAGEGSSRRLRLDLALEDARTGDTVQTIGEEGSDAEIIDLVGRAGARLRAALGLGESRTPDERWARAALPADGEAARLYAEALVKRRAWDTIGAQKLLEQAIARDPAFALGHSTLADVYYDLGYAAKARAEAQKAVDSATELPREARLLLQARLAKTMDDWPKAIELYRALFTFYPDDLSYGLALSRVQIAGGKSKDALVTLNQLRKLPSPIGDDPAIDRREALAWAKQGLWKQSLAADERAIDKGRKLGERMVVADGESSAAEALYFLGDVKRSRELYVDAKKLYESVGEQKQVVWCAVKLADFALQQGDYETARKTYEDAVAYHRASGSEYGIADMLNAVAQAWYLEGKLKQSLAVYDESLLHFRNIGEKEGIGNVLANGGDALMLEGEVAAAEARYREALPLFREVGMRAHEADCEHQIAWALRRQGHLDESRKHNALALSMLREIGDKEKTMVALLEEAERKRDEDDLTGADQAIKEAQAIADAQGMEQMGRAARMVQAWLTLDGGDVNLALAQARAVVARAYEAKTNDDERALAEALLSRVLVAAADRDEAGKAAARALALTAHTEALDVAWEIAIETAPARADCGHRHPLIAVIDAVTKKQLVDWRLEAELATDEIGIACADASARAALAALAKEAEAAGYKRIARLAAADGR